MLAWLAIIDQAISYLFFLSNRQAFTIPKWQK